jgi:hypothetical protein
MTDAICRSCADTGYDLARRPRACGLVPVVTEEWPAANGRKRGSVRNDGNTQPPGFRLRPIGDELVCGRQPFHGPDDLCVAVAPDASGGWYCRVYQLEPYRHIHVRPVRYRWEPERPYEGLTGRAMTP